LFVFGQGFATVNPKLAVSFIVVDEATPVAKDGHAFVLERYPKRFRVSHVDEPTSTKWLCDV